MDEGHDELLRSIMRISAAPLVDGKNLSAGAPLLQRLGVDTSVTAAIYDTSPASVRAVLSQVKKTKADSAKRRSAE